MKRKWIRLYVDVVYNPKVQRLSDSLFRFWVNCLCLFGMDWDEAGNGLASTQTLSWVLRLPEPEIQQNLSALCAAKLLKRVGSSYVPHDWDEHQFKSDRSTERVQRFRNGKRNALETPQNRTDTEAEACSSTEKYTTGEKYNTQAAAPSALLPAASAPIPSDLAGILETFRAFGRGCSDRDLKTCQRLWDKLAASDRQAASVDIQASVPLWRGRPTEKIPQPWNYLEGRYWERNVNRRQPEQEMGKFERNFRKAAAEFIRETSAGGNKP